MIKVRLISMLMLCVAQVTFAQWKLVWSDEFNYTGLPDPNKWGYDVGAGGWGNGEAQYYNNARQENSRVENGNLILEARRDWAGAEYSSCRLVSRNKGDWKYGRVEVRAKIPVGQGLWPAIWMLPTDWEYGGWPASGEIDIMESFALGGLKYDKVEANIHTQAYNHSIGTNKGAAITGLSNIEQNYHVYGVSWYADKMVFDVDGREYFTFVNEGTWQKWPYDKRFHLIMNIAIGGALGTWIDPNIFPKRMEVDYVRVYQQSTGPISTTGLVTVYNDCNYQGFHAGLSVGDYSKAKLAELGISDNAVSSLKIMEGYKAILFDGDNFTGNSIEITDDNGCVGNFNDLTSSVRILPNGVTNLGAKTYFLQNRESSLYVDVAGGEVATADGVNIFQYPLTSTKNQQFEFQHLGNGSYKIVAKHSGKVMDVDGIKKENGANIQQWAYYGTDNQKFIAVPTGDGYFKLVAQHSGRIVEVINASKDQMANIQQYDNNNQKCGQWKLVPTNMVTGTGTGLRANYFEERNFETPVFTRIDQKLDFDWGAGTPHSSVSANDFSVRWSGKVQAKVDGEHTFYVNADDGRKLWVNGQLIIDNWNGGSYESSGKITLTAGQTVNIRIDYYEGVGDAKMQLLWSTNILPKEIIPTSQLYPNTLPTISFISPANNATVYSNETVQISLNASDADGVSKVEIYDGATLLKTITASPYTYSWSKMSLGLHTLTARVYDSFQAVTSTSSRSITVKEPLVTNVDEAEITDVYNVYPNPVQNELIIEATKIIDKISVLDVQGRVQREKINVGVNRYMLNTEGLSSGVYLVEIEVGESVKTVRLVKE